MWKVVRRITECPTFSIPKGPQEREGGAESIKPEQHCSRTPCGWAARRLWEGHLRSPLQVIGRETSLLKDAGTAVFNRNTEKGAPIRKYKICIINNNKINNKISPVTTASRLSLLKYTNLPRLFHWYSTWSVIQLLHTSLHQTATHSEDIFGIPPKTEPSWIFHMANIIKFMCTRSRTSALSNRT